MPTTPRALCATLIRRVGDLWFSTLPADREQAREICHRCPLLDGCAQAGLDDPKNRGVWGALDTGDRDLMQGRRRPNPDNDGDNALRPRRECGSEQAFKAHRARKEDCRACEAVHNTRVLADRLELLKAAHAAGGTEKGAATHRQLGEEPCEPCRLARSTAQSTRKAAAAARQGLRALPGGEEPPGRTSTDQTTGAAA